MPDRRSRTIDWLMAYARDHLAHAEGAVLDLARRKISHTMRVLAYSQHIVRELRPAPELAEAAILAAILHDVGRFPQLVDRVSFDDHTGYNHAEEGAKLLEQADALDGVALHWREVVLIAIRFHNRDVIPDGLEPDAKLVLEILRDADKLDGLHNATRYLRPDNLHGKALKSGLTWHPTEVSPEVVDLALARRLIPYATIRWSNDFILFMACWLYDLHFPYAYTCLRRGQFDRLLGLLPDGDPFGPLKAQLRADLDRFAAKG